MPTQTPVLGITELSSSQSQPEVPVNNAIRTLEQGVGIFSVLDSTLTAPPSGSPAPVDGDAYIVATSPTGAWAGQAKTIAYMQGGVWKFITPHPGWLAYDQNAAAYKKFVSGSWTSASI